MSLVLPEIIEVPPKAIEDFILNPVTRGFDRFLEGERAEALITVLQGLTQHPKDR